VSDRRSQKTPVASDLDEGSISRLQGEFVAAGVGGVEDAEPVPGVRNLEHRPGCAVDQDGVPEDTVHVIVFDAGLAL
jgi:hypothetical protein